MIRDEPSYLGSMLISTPNMVAVGIGMGLAGAMMVVGGLVLGAIPLVLLAAGEAIAAMIVPNLPGFRNKVMRTWRADKRARQRQSVLAELGQRTGFRLASDGYSLVGASMRGEDGRAAAAYNDMIKRIHSLSRVAGDRRTRLGPAEVERLHEAALDYLSMWLARLIIAQRANSVDVGELKAKVNSLNGQIQEAKRQQEAMRVVTLERARNEYAGLIRSHQSLGPRREAIEAAMIAMPDKINEIQQMVMAAPYASGIDSRLEDSLARLRLAEEVEQQVRMELYEEVPVDDLRQIAQPTPSAASKQAAMQAKAARIATR